MNNEQYKHLPTGISYNDVGKLAQHNNDIHRPQPMNQKEISRPVHESLIRYRLFPWTLDDH